PTPPAPGGWRFPVAPSSLLDPVLVLRHGLAMCGRFSLTATPEEVQELFGLEEIEDFPARYNIAPTQPILIVAGDRSRGEGDNRTDRRALLARWGFLPGWVKDPAEFPLLINARSETAA